MALRAVLGVDLAGSYEPVVPLLGRLGFSGLSVTALAVIEAVVVDGFFPELGQTHPLTAIYEELREANIKAAEGAVAALSAIGIAAEAKTAFGDAAARLRGTAEEEHADLVAVGWEHKGRFNSLLFGSVSKGLAQNGRASLLVGKKPLSHDGPLNVVVATDHSEYMDRCLDRLLAMAPRQFGQVTLVTAYRALELPVGAVSIASAAKVADAVAEKGAQVAEMNARQAKRLAPLSPRIESVAQQGNPNDVIPAVAKQVGADLVILGAQGHGFLERMIMGSVATHQVIEGEDNLLLLRA